MSEGRCRQFLVLAPLALLLGAAQCPLDLDPCPDLDELCPELECTDYVQNRDGCSICQCADEEPVVTCFSDFECAAGQRCDTVNYCEPSPGCPEGQECDAFCYGRCVDAPVACSSDADCPEGQLCAYFDNARPAEDSAGSGGGAAPIAPSGVCVSQGCGQTDVALPTCPPGTEPSYELGADGCPYPVCIPVDQCRDLVPEQCLQTPGCALVDEPCYCDPSMGACDDCTSMQRCITDSDCYSLGVDACLANPNCELVAAGGSGGGSAGEGVRCEVCDADGNCTPCEGDPAPPPPSDVVCVPRVSDGTCLTDIDCAAGEVCQPSVVCGTGCESTPDGEVCYQECWNERGLCVPSSGSCYDLAPELCLQDPRCQLVDGGVPCDCLPDDPNCGCEAPSAPVCVPLVTSCFGDGECAPGQHCEQVTTCPPCDPSGGLGCAAPCYVEGRCVDGAPPPLRCQADLECPDGQACIEVTICETCGDQGAPEPGADPAPPAPCEQLCWVEGVCANVGASCWADSECSLNEFCDFSQCDGTTNLVACPGTCTPLRDTTLCHEDAQCADGERCATELDVCLQNPDDPTGACWSQCVPLPVQEGVLCLEDGDCANAGGATGTCRFHPDVCLDDPNSDALVCSGWCVEACMEVETPAVDPVTQRCVVFPDSCIPPGFIAGGC